MTTRFPLRHAAGVLSVALVLGGLLLAAGHGGLVQAALVAAGVVMAAVSTGIGEG